MTFTYAGRYAEAAFKTDGTLLKNGAVAVYLPGTTTLASLYTDRGKGTPASNPVTTEPTTGMLTFYVDPGLYDLAGPGISLLSAPVGLDASDPADLNDARIVGAGQKFTVTPTKTSAFTASPWQLVLCDPTGGTFAVTLPAAATAGQQVAVKNLSATGSFTVVPAGSDHINTAGTSSSVQLQDQVITYTSDGVGHWWISGGQKSVSSLDARYGPIVGSDAWLKLHAGGDLDALISGAITRDGNGATTSAGVVWPDGVTGTFTAVTLSTAFPGAVDGFTVSWTGSPATRTVTQPTMTRDATTGAVTNRPAMTVA